MPRHADHWSEKTARRLLAELATSGTSLAQFARERGFQAERLNWWRRRFAREEGPRPARRATPKAALAPLTFIPATIATTPSLARRTERVIVRLGGAIEVEATSTALLSPTWLAAVARALVGGA